MRIYFIVLFIISFGLNASAQESEPVQLNSATTEVTLADLIEQTFHNNPSIQAARSNWEQTIEQYPLETALEDPMLNFSYYIENVAPHKNLCTSFGSGRFPRP